MRKIEKLTGVIEQEGNGYVALCLELDVASQGKNIEEARRNLIEAVELFMETASKKEIKARLHSKFYITPIEVKVG